MFGKRVLVLVPHPDDEVVACCAAIGRAQAEGAEIFALYLTHGCLARATMWRWKRSSYDTIVARRRAEAEEVARLLNIRPVGWSDRPARHLWTSLSAILAEIKSAVAAHGIDQLWIPAYEGGNPDHDGLNAIGQVLNPHVPVLEFAEYNYCEGRSRSQEFPAPNGTETVLHLTPEERARKLSALRHYASESGNLNDIRTAIESFRPLARYDYASAPHPGVVWYARFQWVPFRHPRVDFTNPADVSQTIMKFLATENCVLRIETN